MGVMPCLQAVDEHVMCTVTVGNPSSGVKSLEVRGKLGSLIGGCIDHTVDGMNGKDFTLFQQS